MVNLARAQVAADTPSSRYALRPMTNDERKAIERAQGTLSTLTPATPRDDAIAFDLRYAARHLAGAQAKSVSSEAALNRLRGAALMR